MFLNMSGNNVFICLLHGINLFITSNHFKTDLNFVTPVISIFKSGLKQLILEAKYF